MAHLRRNPFAAPLLASILALGVASSASADLPLQHQSCPIGNGAPACPQLRTAQGKLVSIDISYTASSVFALSVVGDKYGQTNYSLWVWQELDTQGGDIGSFYIPVNGTVEVVPSGASSGNPAQIPVHGSYSATETDPVKLARFVGNSSVPISPIAEPATGVEHPQKVDTGSIQQFYHVSSNVNGTLTLNYQPLLIKPPVIKLPPQKLPKPPFTVPPYPKPKK